MSGAKGLAGPPGPLSGSSTCSGGFGEGTASWAPHSAPSASPTPGQLVPPCSCPVHPPPPPKLDISEGRASPVLAGAHSVNAEPRTGTQGPLREASRTRGEGGRLGPGWWGTREERGDCLGCSGVTACQWAKLAPHAHLTPTRTPPRSSPRPSHFPSVAKATRQHAPSPPSFPSFSLAGEFTVLSFDLRRARRSSRCKTETQSVLFPGSGKPEAVVARAPG